MTSSKNRLFHSRLSSWYEAHGRHKLPWRNTNDPYAIYLSEVMLQQTQVKTVLERFYFPFLERFPNLATLAEAPQEDVLKHWQGLGYYSRAVNLHKAAKASGGSLPDTADGLLALPGIGQNTAYAILAFAFHQPVAILEANVKRIVHRIFALSSASPSQLWEKAAELLDTKQPFNYNQAMMDLGAMICTPRNPDCLACPASIICQGKDNPERYPQKIAKKKTAMRHKRIIVLEDANQRYFVSPRSTRFLHGLYGFIEQDISEPNFEWEGTTHPLNEKNQIGHISQTYSHFTLDAYAHKITIARKHNSWKSADEIEKLPLSGADVKVLKLLA